MLSRFNEKIVTKIILNENGNIFSPMKTTFLTSQNAGCTAAAVVVVIDAVGVNVVVIVMHSVVNVLELNYLARNVQVLPATSNPFSATNQRNLQL